MPRKTLRLPVEKFDGRYSFLSNFFPSIVRLDGESYPTVEHAFQAAKTMNPIERERIRIADTPGQAKRIGRGVNLRMGWDEIRVDLMACLLRQKFEPTSELADALLETRDRELIEGNHWNDTFWGVCNGRGENHLGRLLMEIRKELQDGAV